MFNLLFSPSGRIGPMAFMRGAYTLILVTFLINLFSMVDPIIGAAMKWLLIPTLYCWAVLFIKRFHDSNQSGWMVMLPGLAFVIFYVVQARYVPSIFAAEDYGKMKGAITLAMEDQAGFYQMAVISQQYAPAIAKKIALPGSFIYAGASFLIAYGFNRLIAHDPETNIFGPPKS